MLMVDKSVTASKLYHFVIGLATIIMVKYGRNSRHFVEESYQGGKRCPTTTTIGSPSGGTCSLRWCWWHIRSSGFLSGAASASSPGKMTRTGHVAAERKEHKMLGRFRSR